MKKFMPVLMGLALSTSTLAAPAKWVICYTAGDALGSLTLAIDAKSSPTDLSIKSTISNDDDTESTLGAATVAQAEYQHMKNAGHFDLVFKTAKSTQFGGSSDDSSLLSLTQNAQSKAYSGFLARAGIVYELTCK